MKQSRRNCYSELLRLKGYRPEMTSSKTATRVAAPASLKAPSRVHVTFDPLTFFMWEFSLLKPLAFYVWACALQYAYPLSQTTLLHFLSRGREFCLQGVLILCAISSCTDLITFSHCWLYYSTRVFFYPQWNRTLQNKRVEYRREQGLRKKLKKFSSLSFN